MTLYRDGRRPVASRAGAHLAALAAAVLCLLATACAQPVEGLWPPRPGEAAHRIVVSSDEWHSVIALPTSDPALPFEEWGYADKQYFLEGDSDSCGTLDAVFCPGPGVIEVERCDRPLCDRATPSGRKWTFDLTDAGYARLVEHLRDDVASPEPISHAHGSEWFDTVSSYHGFHHCHHWTAGALRAAGLPIFESLALFKPWFEGQLDRAAEMAREAEAQR